MNMAHGTGQDRRNIFRLRYVLPDGKPHIVYVRCTHWEKEAAASVQALAGRLSNMLASNELLSETLTAPANPPHLRSCERRRQENALRKATGLPLLPGKCECFRRWTDIPQLMPVPGLGEVVAGDG